MATLIDADDFRERFDIDDSDSFPDGRIEPHIGSASRRLRRWVGAEKYAAAVNAAAVSPDPEPTDDETDMMEDLKQAEAHLAYHFAVLGFNTPISSKGIIATSMSDEGKEMRKYLTPEQTAAVAQAYLELAEQFAGPYMGEVTQAVPVFNTDVDDIEWPET